MRHNIKRNKGFTYVELIVVLSIFAVLSAVAIFNYNKFQGKVDIKNLSSDIALKLVQAQKAAVSGTVSTLTFTGNNKPSYGVYFNATTPTKFLYFADLDNSNSCDTSGCVAPNYTIGGEVLSIYNTTKGNKISSLVINGTSCPAISDMTIVFKRPASTAMFNSTTPLAGCTITDVVINIVSQDGTNTAMIEVYPSGRIQIN
jgi:prepilin-type N-terminal cleavage/methylation domain-containing protein